MKRFVFTAAVGLLLVIAGVAVGVLSAAWFSSLFSSLGSRSPRWDHLTEAAGFAVFRGLPSYRKEGERLYQNGCAHCHGPDGSGGRGPALDGVSFDGIGGTVGLFQIVQNGIPGTEMPPSPQMTPRERLRVVAFVKSLQYEPPVFQGDIPAGRDLYLQIGCRECHRIGEMGRATGVDLTRVGAKRNPAHLLESLIDPGADTPDGYRLVRVITADNRIISGTRHYEDTFSILLYDGQDRLHSFSKDDLKAFESLPGRSPMPSYKGTLSDSQLDDLVAYLSSLR